MQKIAKYFKFTEDFHEYLEFLDYLDFVRGFKSHCTNALQGK